MSVPTAPTTPTSKLDSLRELGLKDFGSCQYSPSSRTASLPTPGVPTVPLADSVMDASIGDDAAADQWLLITPGAPLLKDMDSFTEGSGAGSFDSIPAAESDEHGNPIYPLSEARVSLVCEPQDEPQDKGAYVLRWLSTLPGAQTSVHDQNRPHTLKRTRSVTEPEGYRPRRPRTRSCPSSRRSDSLAPD